MNDTAHANHYVSADQDLPQTRGQTLDIAATDATVLIAHRLLALSIAALAFGLGVLALRGQGPIAGYLFLYTSASDHVALQVEFLGGCVLLAMLPILAVRKLWIICGIIPLWVLASAWAWRSDASSYGDLVWGAHGIRYLGPFAYMLWCWKPFSHKVTLRCVMGILRIGLAATFAFHGLEALCLLPEFLDYAKSAVSVIGVHIGNATAAKILHVIGCWDISLAFSVLFSRWRWPLYAMALWGTATAGLRILDGWSYYPDTVLRLIHVFPAITLLLLYRADISIKLTDEIKGFTYDNEK